MLVQMKRSVTEVENILNEFWDPIGLEAQAAQLEEYRGFAIRIAAMLSAGASESEISLQLQIWEREDMSLKADEKRALRVSKLLIGVE